MATPVGVSKTPLPQHQVARIDVDDERRDPSSQRHRLPGDRGDSTDAVAIPSRAGNSTVAATRAARTPGSDADSGSSA